MSQVIQGYTQQVKEGDATDPLLVDDQQRFGGQGQKGFRREEWSTVELAGARRETHDNGVTSITNQRYTRITTESIPHCNTRLQSVTPRLI